MVSLQRIEETQSTPLNGGSVAKTGSWTTGTDANASGGAYMFASAAATVTVTIAAASGYTGVSLGALGSYNGGVVSVTVDGVLQPDNWNQGNATTSTTPIWYRARYRPITFANPAASHTIVLTWISGIFFFDFADLYTAATPTAGKLLVGGMSIAAGYSGSAGYPIAATARYGGLLSAWLGMTEDNQAVSGSCLAQGAVLANFSITNGGTDGTNVPEWYRLVDQHTLWSDKLPEIATLHYGINDVRQRGNNDPASNTTANGYGLEQFIQRIREAAWTLHLACPNALLFVLGIGYVTKTAGNTGGYVMTGTPNYQHATEAIALAWNAAMRAVCLEASVATNTVYVDTYGPTLALGDWGLQNALAANDIRAANSADGLHPTADGHAAIATAVLRAIQAARMPTTGRRGGLA